MEYPFAKQKTCKTLKINNLQENSTVAGVSPTTLYI